MMSHPEVEDVVVVLGEEELWGEVGDEHPCLEVKCSLQEMRLPPREDEVVRPAGEAGTAAERQGPPAPLLVTRRG